MDAPPKAREILEAALDDAFTVPEWPSEPPQETVVLQPTIAQPASGDSAEPSLEGSTSTSGDEKLWKEEYDTQVRAWRRQSAEHREKAEKQRLKWETIRAQEREEAERRKSAGDFSVKESWEKLGASGSSVASTAASSHAVEDRSRTGPSTQDGTPDDIHKWENVPSVASSFPSILPDTPPAPPQPTEPPQQPPISATLSIFDSSLSTRTRVLALASSLAVNLVLPFINGVMLGFGEIFARRVVTEWFGWKIPAINIGLRKNPEGRRSIFS